MNDEITSPLKAIRAFCLDCCGGSAYEVKNCTSNICKLKAFRLGRNPYYKRAELTEAQKAERVANLARARKAKEQVPHDTL